MPPDRLTPNQVVAHNLRAARELRGLTQEEAAARLEPHLGTRWSEAVFSAAERSVAGKRIREFDADTLYAFSRAFDLPVTFFLIPPSPDSAVAHPDAASDAEDSLGFLERIVALDDAMGHHMMRIVTAFPSEEIHRFLRLRGRDFTFELNVLEEAEEQLRTTFETVRAMREYLERSPEESAREKGFVAASRAHRAGEVEVHLKPRQPRGVLRGDESAQEED